MRSPSAWGWILFEFHRRNAIRLGDIDRLSAQLGEDPRTGCRE